MKDIDIFLEKFHIPAVELEEIIDSAAISMALKIDLAERLTRR